MSFLRIPFKRKPKCLIRYIRIFTASLPRYFRFSSTTFRFVRCFVIVASFPLKHAWALYIIFYYSCLNHQKISFLVLWRIAKIGEQTNDPKTLFKITRKIARKCHFVHFEVIRIQIL